MASEAELSKRWILAVADDLTGALEIGAKFAGRGMRARVTTELSVRERPDVPVLVVDTESKHPPAEPEAFRLLAPQRGLIATAQDASPRAKLGTVRSLRRVRQVALSSHWRAMPRQPQIPGTVKLLLPPRQSRGVSHRTRHLSADAAFSVVREVVDAALRFDPWLIYKKTDSTLRGNIAPELRALLELIPCRSMVYAPAYPEMGRTVRRGRLFVGGEPVDQTVFTDDPVDPVRESDLGVILRGLPVQVEDGETSEDVLAVAARIIAADPPSLVAGP